MWIWLLPALAAPLLQGIANILDTYLSGKLFKSLWTLTFYSTLLNVIFIPLIFILQAPSLPPVQLLPFFILIGCIEIFYLFPYYKALQKSETSVVTALFSLGRIFVPIFAFLLVGEVLQPIQYIGFALVITASIGLSLAKESKFKFNESFFYMLICSIALAVEVVIYKYLFESVSWSTGLIWPLVFSFCVAASFLAIPGLRKDILQSQAIFKKNISVFASEEIVTFLGTAASLYAVSIAPVTLVKGIGSLQAFFVLIYALIFHKFFPGIFKEEVDRRSLLRKSAFFALMIVGVILTLKEGIG